MHLSIPMFNHNFSELLFVMVLLPTSLLSVFCYILYFRNKSIIPFTYVIIDKDHNYLFFTLTYVFI